MISKMFLDDIVHSKLKDRFEDISKTVRNYN